MISNLSKFPPVDFKLSADEIHIWFGVLDQPESEYSGFIQMLSIDERIRAGRFHFQKDRNRFIARHGMLRRILGCYLGVEASDIRFCHGKNGKPAITDTFGRETIQFNLSHSNGVAVFAFARNHEIGVDIEHVSEMSEMEQIVKRFFSVKENEIFTSLPESQKKEAFYYGWTCKEAFVKALGDGLSQPLDTSYIPLVPGESAELLRIEDDSVEASQWSIQSLKPAPGYVGALAVKSHSFVIKYM